MGKEKGLTLDERRELIKTMFKARNEPVEEVPEPTRKKVAAPKEEQIDEEEEAEKLHVKRKQRYKKKQQGRLRPRGRR